MSLSENQSTEVISMLNQNDFVLATVAQLNKDLQGLFFEELTFSQKDKTSVIDQLTALLQPVLQALSKNQPEQLSQFIYRVDLPEKKFFDSISADHSLEHLSFLVIEREALKVWLRLKFS